MRTGVLLVVSVVYGSVWCQWDWDPKHGGDHGPFGKAIEILQLNEDWIVLWMFTKNHHIYMYIIQYSITYIYIRVYIYMYIHSCAHIFIIMHIVMICYILLFMCMQMYIYMYIFAHACAYYNCCVHFVRSLGWLKIVSVPWIASRRNDPRMARARSPSPRSAMSLVNARNRGFPNFHAVKIIEAFLHSRANQ